MSAPSLAQRSTRTGVVVVWVASLLIGIAAGIFAPIEDRAVWMCIGLGSCLVIAFAVQVFDGRAKGFIGRVSASALGAAVIMGLVSAAFGLAAIARI